MANIRSIYDNAHSRMHWPTSFKYTFDAYFEIGMRTRSAAKKVFFSQTPRSRICKFIATYTVRTIQAVAMWFPFPWESVDKFRSQTAKIRFQQKPRLVSTAHILVSIVTLNQFILLLVIEKQSVNFKVTKNRNLTQTIQRCSGINRLAQTSLMKECSSSVGLPLLWNTYHQLMQNNQTRAYAAEGKMFFISMHQANPAQEGRQNKRKTARVYCNLYGRLWNI